MENKLRATSEYYKPYLKRFFVIKYFGGFCGLTYSTLRHEIQDDSMEFEFTIKNGYEYYREATVLDGDYFDFYIEHVDKHGNLIKTETLKLKNENKI